MVMLNHFLVIRTYEGLWWWKILMGGWLGVDLFFVLSGFLITGILVHTRDKPNYFYNFYLRRTLRIFPLYYGVIFFLLVFNLLFEKKFILPWWDYDSLFWYFAYASNFAMSFKGDWTYNSDTFSLGHFWSLAIEEQFYLVFPLLVWLLPARHLKGVLLLMVLLGTPCRHFVTNFYGDWAPAVFALPSSKMDLLASGGLLAIFLRELGRPATGTERMMVRFVLCAAGVYLLEALAKGANYGMGTICAIFFTSLVYLTVNGTEHGTLKRFFEGRFLVHLGKYSYALYVFHHFINPVFKQHIGNQLIYFPLYRPEIGQVVYIVVLFGVSYVLARLSWFLLEKPCLDIKERFTRK